MFAAAGCGSLDRSVTRDHCATSSDCNPGRVCAAGICKAPTDGAADAPQKDAVPGADAGVEEGRDLPVPADANSEARGLPESDAAVDAPEAPPDGDLDVGADVAADSEDGNLDVDAARDAGVGLPPDPCATGPGQESPAALPGLLAALPGFWRRCPTSGAVDPDVSWFVGGTRVVQLDARHWWRCADGQPPSCGATAQGLYFRVLEGSNSVFHFADWVDPLNGGGADISIRYYAGSKLLQLEACDGASRCSNNATYLVFVGPAPGS
jgi:hypothetical protein